MEGELVDGCRCIVPDLPDSATVIHESRLKIDDLIRQKCNGIASSNKNDGACRHSLFSKGILDVVPIRDSHLLRRV